MKGGQHAARPDTTRLALTFVPLLRSGMAVAAAVRITLAADTRGRGHAVVHGAHA